MGEVDKKQIQGEISSSRFKREICSHLWESGSRRNGDDGEKSEKSEIAKKKKNARQRERRQ